MYLFADMKAAPVRADSEAAHGLGGKAAAGAPQAGGAVAHAAADALTLKLAAKARRKMRITTKNLRHDDTSCDKHPGGLPAFLFSPLLSPGKGGS